ncbi:MAG: IS630 family transposase [Acidobacteria bacterium]|nr:IS630 family transposase [Acidobacteriota bacterium]
MAAQRNAYKRAWFWRRARALHHDRFIFVDEAGVNTAMTRRFARAPRGERACESVPRNYGEQTSVISALSLRRGLLATMTVTGAVDTLCFDAYVARVLSPHLRRGDVVVLDNLGAHKASCLEQVAEARGARVLWLPPYSPDYSPIENCWSKIKTALRAAKARTRDELEKALAKAIELVTSADVRGWFKLCGYSVARK